MWVLVKEMKVYISDSVIKTFPLVNLITNHGCEDNVKIYSLILKTAISARDSRTFPERERENSTGATSLSADV